MNTKVAVCFLALVAIGMTFGAAVKDEPVPAPAAAAVSSVIGLPGGHCYIPWRHHWSQYLPDLWDCRAFYECDPTGKPVHFHCPSGLCWNQLKETCDYPGKGVCRYPCW